MYMKSSSSSNTNNKEIYNIPNSGWSSSEWNWGYEKGTGHDCALICRNQYNTRQSREELVNNLMMSSSITEKDNRIPNNFEEVKLILGLAWQKGRWDGSDGGKGGYNEVLSEMANAERYEAKTEGTEEEENECTLLLLNDMKDRFHLLKPTDDAKKIMSLLDYIVLDNDIDAAVRVCSGLVLKEMGFVDSGL